MGLDLFESYRYIVRSPDFAGTQWIARSRDDEVRIMDIALLPEYCNRGIGTTLLRGLQSEAAAAGKPRLRASRFRLRQGYGGQVAKATADKTAGRLLRIHVERFTPALRLYERLGFRLVEDRGVYLFMEGRQLPTSNSQVPRRVVRNVRMKGAGTSGLVRLQPQLFEGLPWELEVGGWELTTLAGQATPFPTPSFPCGFRASR